MKVLLVEDNINLVDRIKRQLNKTYPIDVAHTGEDALYQASRIDYGVIILDLGLPDMSGVDVCKQIRSKDTATPILVLTGIGSVDSCVNLLNSGADDYITKPFNSEELSARISCLARRCATRSDSPMIMVGDLTIDIERRRVYRAGIYIPLRRKEFNILEYLARNKGRILTREMIIDNAWELNQSSWNSTVDVHINYLRGRVDRPFSYPLIKTVYGLGYTIDAHN